MKSMLVACAAGIGVIAGSLLTMHVKGRSVEAAGAAGGRFAMQAATVDESNGDGTESPAHELFMLDTETGHVWKYQGLVWSKS